RLYEYGYAGELPGTVRLSGFRHCNLTTINRRDTTTPEAFYEACVHASVIGTFHAAYTDMPYLGPVTRRVNDHEAWLGASICGFVDNPPVLLDAASVTQGAALARAANCGVAGLLGIAPAGRLPRCKPEGTASLLRNAA